MPPPSTTERSWSAYRSGCPMGYARTPRTRCACSDCLCAGGRAIRPAAGRLPWESPSPAARCHRAAPRGGRRGRRDSPSDPDHDPLRHVPGVEIARERLARGALDGLARAEDVPAERLVGEEQPVVDIADISLRRVQVDVHLLEDHALLLLDLGRVETRVAEHVHEHVQGDVSCLRRALDVVAGDLLAGEGVELAADRVDLRRDRARSRAALRPLEEHVLGEVGDALRARGLVARTCGEHHEARDRRNLWHRRRQDADAVCQRRLLEDSHWVRWYRQASCPGS